MKGKMCILAVLGVLLIALQAEAHRSGCHRWHSCPSDRGTYICGDLGYCSGCPDNQYCSGGRPRAAAPASSGKAESRSAKEQEQPAPAVLSGRVVGVHDGDTITVLDGTRQVKVRLANIDTPERGQPFGKRAKQALSSLVYSKTVTLDTKGRDRYGRTIATVFVDGLNVNKALVRQGYAWAYRKYLDDDEYLDLEAQARQERLGIWSLPEAKRVPPWEWRRKKRGR